MSKVLSTIFLAAALLILIGSSASAQTYDLRFVVDQNDGFVGGTYSIRIQIKSNGSVFGLGSSNLVFTYNTVGLASPDAGTDFTPLNFSGVTGGVVYNTMTLTEPVSGRLSVNIDLATTNNGTDVPATYLDVCQIDFTIDDALESSELSWRTVNPNATTVFDETQPITPVTPNLLNDQDDALPVSLNSFSVLPRQDAVVLNWSTASELNNAGFEVYRSNSEGGEYQLLAGYLEHAALEGAGNSNSRIDYEFLDRNIQQEQTYWYQIADVDFSGVRTFHGPLSVETNDALPAHFSLSPNYPNPFNPETTIRFDVPTGNELTPVSLVIYNSLGAQVRVLVQERMPAGSHLRSWDGRGESGAQMASGVYFLRMQANQFSQTTKMLLLR